MWTRVSEQLKRRRARRSITVISCDVSLQPSNAIEFRKPQLCIAPLTTLACTWESNSKLNNNELQMNAAHSHRQKPAVVQRRPLHHVTQKQESFIPQTMTHYVL
jgi:hypothetical protein